MKKKTQTVRDKLIKNIKRFSIETKVQKQKSHSGIK